MLNSKKVSIMKNVRSIFYCVVAVLFTASIISSCKDGEDGKDGLAGADGTNGKDGNPGSVITIVNCYWYIDGENTGIEACGTQGEPGEPGEPGTLGSHIYIGDNGNWWIDGEDTEIPATGPQGPQGAPGSVVYIGENGNWYIDGEDSGVKAAGTKISIGSNGNWWIDDEDTGYKAVNAPVIELKTPANNLTIEPVIDIAAASYPMTFSWEKVSGVTGYMLKFSLDEEFPDESTYTVDAGDVEDYVTDIGLEVFNLLPVWANQILYWTVAPKGQDVIVDSRVRTIRVNWQGRIGRWLFDDSEDLTKATIGKPLQIVTVVGTPQIFPIDGPSESNKAIRISCAYNQNVGYFLADHGITGKTLENYVSEYTLFFEFKVNSWRRPNYATVVYNAYIPLFKTRIDQPTVDPEVFVARRVTPTTEPIALGDIGTGATGYAAEVVELERWHRLYLTYNTNVQQYYLDGTRIINATSADARHRLNLNGVFFFATNHNDINFENFDVAEVSMWNRQLTAEEIEELEK